MMSYFDQDDIINDIALIRLDDSVTLTDAIQLAQLPADNSKSYVGEIGRVSGWGETEGSSVELKYAEELIISNEECAEDFRPIPDIQMCLSKANERGSSSGDGGGPLTVDGVQVGVVSYGNSDVFEGYPSVFTRVASYLDWIAENSQS